MTELTLEELTRIMREANVEEELYWQNPLPPHLHTVFVKYMRLAYQTRMTTIRDMTSDHAPDPPTK
jgi:hypothetical protein